jgi:choline dehydrogenase-like flavoprotein
VGTAIVSNSTDTGGVVGPDLTVKNTNGLRVVDASVIVRFASIVPKGRMADLTLLQPRAVAGFPQARVYLIAERVSDLIKAKYSA